MLEPCVVQGGKAGPASSGQQDQGRNHGHHSSPPHQVLFSHLPLHSQLPVRFHTHAVTEMLNLIKYNLTIKDNKCIHNINNSINITMKQLHNYRTYTSILYSIVFQVQLFNWANLLCVSDVFNWANWLCV